MKSVSIIDPTADARWDELVRRHPFGSIFHSSDWARVLVRSFSYRPFYFVLEEDGVISGGLPFMQIDSWLTGKRLICLPRTSYCDPLVESSEDLDILLDAAIKLTTQSHLDFLEIKTQKNTSMSNGTKLKEYSHFRNQILCLEPGLDGLWKGFDRTCVRQRISRAQKSGVVVRFGKSLEDLRGFYNLHKQSSSKNGVPHRPFSFFQNMWDTLGSAEMMFLVLADIGTDLGSAGILLKSKDSIIFEFVGNNYELMDHSPAHLIVWEMIQYACKEGFRYFDFGLTPPGDAGLINFKSRWGTQNNALKYYYYPDVVGYKRFVATHDGLEAVRTNALSRISEWLKASVACKMYKHFG